MYKVKNKVNIIILKKNSKRQSNNEWSIYRTILKYTILKHGSKTKIKRALNKTEWEKTNITWK